ncbi:hypothetical protein N181_09755 [Sinorhizobium fredii USDA 205]|uniref:DUF4102 domain-containing protein n=1 Tax=Rhizobium fredii TaxID=380 RepID=A0A844AAX8_RHIFR|nr:site-specific integrase [Sinorhizobium fredii]KSV90944.1 hypothetical protein N181_09755 [Sinorhizobium fredii USDA 205]MQX08660.1 DUF4102 domain-containing protein [Sinorhizobium fredii]GEC30527.1 integrase [Sinorhizobium fredii]GLS09724.1 integrase [Sinorhizobium fredii]
MAKALTAKFIDSVKPSSARKEIPDGGMPGLYLVVQPKREQDGKELPASLSWAVRYRIANRARKLTIGPYPRYGLADARTAAGKALRAVSEGIDPAEEKRLGKLARSNDENQVDVVLNEFIRRHVEAKTRESSARESKRLIDAEVRPEWKKRHIQSITRRDVISLLDNIVDRGVGTTANRVHALLRKFFNWCIERDIVTASPVANVKAPAAEVSRDRVLSNDEIRLLWMASDKIGWPFGPMAKLLLLTGQRRDEVAAAGRREFNLDVKEPVWTIPKDRSKNGIAHAVPLAPAASDILNSLPVVEGDANLMFTTTGETAISGFSRAKAALDAEMLKIAQQEAAERGEDPENVQLAPWRFHDLRRTCASGMASLGQPIHVVEAALNHRSGTIQGVTAVYVRHDFLEEKRRALSAWASMVEEIVGKSSSGTNIVRLAGSRPL